MIPEEILRNINKKWPFVFRSLDFNQALPFFESKGLSKGRQVRSLTLLYPESYTDLFIFFFELYFFYNNDSRYRTSAFSMNINSLSQCCIDYLVATNIPYENIFWKSEAEQKQTNQK